MVIKNIVNILIHYIDKLPNLETLFGATFIFWLIFTYVGEFLIRIHYPFYDLAFALIAASSVMYFSHKRDEHYEDLLRRIEDELKYQQKNINIDYLDKIVRDAKFLKEKDDERKNG